MHPAAATPLPLPHLKHEIDCAREASPRGSLFRQSLAAGGSQLVEARLSIVLRHSPVRRDVALTLVSVELRIERSLPDLNHTLRAEIEAFGDSPPVHGTELQ